MKRNEQEYIVPQRDIEALARCLLPQIQKYFESEDGKREFAEWQAQQEKLRKAHSPPAEIGGG